MRSTGIKRIGLFLLAALFCLLPVHLSAANDAQAEDLSARCKYGGDFTVHADRLTDADFDTAQRVAKGKTLTVSWTDDVPVASVFLSFYYEPADYTVLQDKADGSLLSEEEGILLYNNLIAVSSETRKVAIRADADNCAFCSLYVFGEGTVPDYHPFQPTVQKADYMTFAMHPDDDVLFLGAIYPICEAERGLTGMSMIMSTKLPEKNQRLRRQEDLNGAWILGLKTQPYFGGFPDIPQDYYKKFGHTFTVDDVTRYAVTQIRRYRPEVVITQDLNGEYGHWQHKVLAEGVQKAVPLAADPDYQPKGYPKSEAWTVKKLYIHLYGENKLTLDVESPIDALDGKTAFQAAQEAFQCHASQTKKDNHHVSVTEYSIAEFGLAYTTVGEDTPGLNDLFEHIAPESLSVQPAPAIVETPTPTPTPTPEPTPISTPEPTPEPTQEPVPVMPDPSAGPTQEQRTEQEIHPVQAETETPQPTIAVHSETSEPTQSGPAQKSGEEESGLSVKMILLVGGGLVILLLILLAALFIARKRR